MTSTHRLIVVSLLSTTMLTGCVVWQSDYDKLQSQNQQLQQQLAASQQQNSRLQGAIKYTVNSDLLFAPGSWEMRPQGQQVIANLAKKLAPTQQNHLMVSGYTDNAPIGEALRREGVDLEPRAIKKTCRRRDAVSHLAGGEARSSSQRRDSVTQVLLPQTIRRRVEHKIDVSNCRWLDRVADHLGCQPHCRLSPQLYVGNQADGMKPTPLVWINGNGRKGCLLPSPCLPSHILPKSHSRQRQGSEWPGAAIGEETVPRKWMALNFVDLHQCEHGCAHFTEQPLLRGTIAEE